MLKDTCCYSLSNKISITQSEDMYTPDFMTNCLIVNKFYSCCRKVKVKVNLIYIAHLKTTKVDRSALQIKSKTVQILHIKTQLNIICNDKMSKAHPELKASKEKLVFSSLDPVGCWMWFLWIEPASHRCKQFSSDWHLGSLEDR